MAYKIVVRDNFGRENIAEYFLNVPTMQYEKAVRLKDFLNENLSSDTSEEYYDVVDMDYKLWRGMEEFV